MKRSAIVGRWLSRTDDQFLMLLDDDILLGTETLEWAIRDFKMLLSAGHKVGALAIHGGHTVHQEFNCGRTVFGKLTLTGEAAVILNREAIEEVGNQFGRHAQGYADTQWHALRAAGWDYVTRINPAYEAQHIGLGDGSVIQYGFDKAFWLTDAWRANVPGKPYLRVPGFDVERFLREVKKDGCKAACIREYQRTETTMSQTQSPGKLHDQVLMPKGKLKILVREGSKSGKIVKEWEDDNVVVNNALYQFARLLAGVDQTDRLIDRMQFGAGTTAESVTDTALGTPLTPIKTVSSPAEFPDDRSVKFTAFLLEDEMNGFPVSEAALLFANSTMATRKVFPALNKSEDFIFEFQWTLSWPESS